jgi:hypothetical protein
MSIKLMSAAWEIPEGVMSQGRKFLLVALCDMANDAGACFPSVGYLARKCSMSERTAQGHIQWLAENKFLSLETREGRSTIYTVNAALLLAPPQNLHPRRICTPAESAPTPAESAPTPAESAPTPAESAPITQTKPPPNHHLTTTGESASASVVVSDATQLEKSLPWPAGLSAEQRQHGARLLCGLPVAQAEVCVRLLAQALASRDVPKPAGYLAALAVRARAGTLDVSALESTVAVRAEQVPVSAAHRDWKVVKAEAERVSAAERAAEAAHWARLRELGEAL